MSDKTSHTQSPPKKELPKATANRQTGHGGPGGGGPLGLGAGIVKPKDFKGTMKKLLHFLAPHKIQLITVVLITIGSTVFTIVGPKILASATDEIVAGITSKLAGGPGIDFNAVLSVIYQLLILYAVASVFMFFESFIMAGITQRVTFNLRSRMAGKINKLPLNYFDKNTHGEVLSRVVNDVDTVGQSLGQSLTQVITSVTTVIGILIMMFSISPLMTLVALVTIPLSTVVVMIVIRFSQKYFKRQQEYLGYVNGQVEEIYGGHIVVKAFCAEEKAVNEFNGYNDTLYESAWKSQFLSGVIMPAMNLIGNIGYVGVSVLGGILAGNGVITVGDILSFITYIRRFNQPIMQLGQISNLLQSTVAAAERVFEFLDEEELLPECANPVSVKDVKGDVRFNDVTFGYDPETVVLKNINAEIKAGQTCAIVGPTGGGKTTVVKLLMRFYEVNSGSITIDGHDIRDFTREDLRDMLAMVLQDTWLFNGTIMENIRYGRDDATDDEVKAAADAARVDHFVKTLPGGYEMELNEEASNISQGQKQLMTIARAILSDPRILILDEATSSVDTRTEALIQEAMVNLMAGRTSFIIAHRLSTIRSADIILVVNEGAIVEQGTHDELLARDGFYAELYRSQFEAA
ncbi:MAG: ABC transporter ATP-binding protein/permease [Clostridiales bacterium]|jgi:ATP-binding cassette subfamily B protein|nr:ABC transporter ATP-binding protein/permease [Clostridiales bacterium]